MLKLLNFDAGQGLQRKLIFVECCLAAVIPLLVSIALFLVRQQDQNMLED